MSGAAGVPVRAPTDPFVSASFSSSFPQVLLPQGRLGAGGGPAAAVHHRLLHQGTWGSGWCGRRGTVLAPPPQQAHYGLTAAGFTPPAIALCRTSRAPRAAPSSAATRAPSRSTGRRISGPCLVVAAAAAAAAGAPDVPAPRTAAVLPGCVPHTSTGCAAHPLAPPCRSRTRDGFTLVEERAEMPSLKEVALEVLPRAAAAAAAARR